MRRCFEIIFILIFLPSCADLKAQSLKNTYPIYHERLRSPGNTIYYIDPETGNDSDVGTKSKSPWKTFIRINQLILAPGDQVKIIKGGSFHETLMLMADGTEILPVKVDFAPGKYDFYPDRSLKLKLHISNTNDRPYLPKAIAMMFDSCEHVQVEGNRATLNMHGKMIETYVQKCSDITLKGLIYDYNRPTVSEVRVTNVSTNYVDLKVHPDSKFSIKDSILTWQGEGWNYVVGNYWQALNAETDNLQRLEMQMNKLRFLSMGGTNIRALFRSNPGFEKGLVYQNRDIIRDCAGIFIKKCRNVILADIRIKFMHGMGVVVQACENIKIEKISVRPDESSGRTCAAWADILHFSGCKGKIEIKDSYLSAANDDAINIHGIHLKVKKVLDPKHIVVEFMHDQTYGFNPYQAMDSIEFVPPGSLIPVEQNEVLESSMLSDTEIALTLKNPVAASAGVGNVIENITTTPQVWIHHNVIDRIPTRGILTTSRRKTLIEDNQIKHTHMSGIAVLDDAGYWYESGMVKNLIIFHNEFLQCGDPVIQIHPENTETGKGGVHSNISIINNKFYVKGRQLLSAKSTKGLNFLNNHVIMKKEIGKIPDMIELTDCDLVKISNNKLSISN